MGNGKRWIRGKGRGNITQPAVISAYNRGMGCVDLLDRAEACNLRQKMVLATDHKCDKHLFIVGVYIGSFLVKSCPKRNSVDEWSAL